MEPNGKYEEEADFNNLQAIVGKEVPFVVPAAYFEDLPARLMQYIQMDKISAGSIDSFPVPQSYFEELPGRIQSNIAANQLKEITLSDGFTVPAGYFETLSDKIIAATASRKAPVRVIALNSWIGYAAAACVTVAIAATLLFNQQAVPIDDQLAAIPEQEIIQYLQEQSAPGDASFIKENIYDASGLSGHDGITSSEIEQYLDNTL